MEIFQEDFYDTEYMSLNNAGDIDDFTPYQDMYALNKISGEYMNIFLVKNNKLEPYILDSSGNLLKLNCN